MMFEIVIAINIGLFVLLALSLNIIVGYAGQPNLGHAAFYGIGAYTSAILSSMYGLPFLVSFLLAGLVTAALGLLLGLISLRVKESFFAVTTIGVNFIIVAIFRYWDFFGGPMGYVVPAAKLFNVTFNYPHYLAFIIVCIVLVVLLSVKIQNSWIGMALGGIRNDEDATRSLGIDIRKFKIIAFVLANFIAGCTGSIYAHFIGFIYPNDFSFIVSVSILAMAVVGGLGTISGPILGALFLGIIPEIFRALQDYRFLLYGVALVLTMRFQPSGLHGMLDRDSKLWRFLNKIKNNLFKSPQRS